MQVRREGYEFMVGPPKVINKKVDDKLLEPSQVILSPRWKYLRNTWGLWLNFFRQMIDMEGVGFEGTTLLKYKIPTCRLLGLWNAILTASRGTAILNTIVDSYGPWAGDIITQDLGSLVAFEDGSSTSYALRFLLVLALKFTKVK